MAQSVAEREYEAIVSGEYGPLETRAKKTAKKAPKKTAKKSSRKTASKRSRA